VGAGAEYVRVPRDPALMRGRASASPATIANTARTASTLRNERKSLMDLSQCPCWGVRYIGGSTAFVKGRPCGVRARPRLPGPLERWLNPPTRRHNPRKNK